MPSRRRVFGGVGPGDDSAPCRDGPAPSPAGPVSPERRGSARARNVPGRRRALRRPVAARKTGGHDRQGAGPVRGEKTRRMGGSSVPRTARPSPACIQPSPPCAGQRNITGPKSAETRAVPLECTRKSAKGMPGVIGSTYPPSAGCPRASPSTAERTDIAGAMIASSASVPLSPRVSARRIRTTSLTVTIRTGMQRSSETTPSASRGPRLSRPTAWRPRRLPPSASVGAPRDLDGGAEGE